MSDETKDDLRPPHPRMDERGIRHDIVSRRALYPAGVGYRIIMHVAACGLIFYVAPRSSNGTPARYRLTDQETTCLSCLAKDFDPERNQDP